MRVHEIRLTVEGVLSELGFDGGLWAWRNRPNTLEILIGEEVRTIEMRSGMSQKRLNREIGRIEGWADWSRRNKPARQSAGIRGFEPGVQMDIEELIT
jgi:hypothetical protein